MFRPGDFSSVVVPLVSTALLSMATAATVCLKPLSYEQIKRVRQSNVIRSWEYVDGLPEQIAVFQTVFWEPRDTTSLRELIANTDLVRGKSVLEIGTGSGLVSLCCLRAGASYVVATDVNATALANAQYNANVLGVSDRFETRLAPLSSSGAFEVCQPDEKFDVIVSNPPWENAQPRSIDEYALYDRDFALLKSILGGAGHHLNEGGRLLLAYGCRDAILAIERIAGANRQATERLDERSLSTLKELFLPGMLVEVFPQTD